MSGHSTVTDESSEPLPPENVRVARFGTRPQVSAVVALTTWTDVLAPAARVAGPKWSGPPVIDQPPVWLWIDQLSPAIAGSVSLTATLNAEPRPVLVTVKPIWSPALTLSSSAVFVMTMTGQSTVIVSLDSLLSVSAWASFEAPTV